MDEGELIVVMLFYLIKNIDQEYCNGVIIESDNHQYEARLFGSNGVDDPARVIPMEIRGNGGHVNQIISTDGNNRKTISFKKGSPEFMNVILNKLKLPLRLFKQGKVTKLDTPRIITKRIWDQFADPEMDMPNHCVL